MMVGLLVSTLQALGHGDRFMLWRVYSGRAGLRRGNLPRQTLDLLILET